MTKMSKVTLTTAAFVFGLLSLGLTNTIAWLPSPTSTTTTTKPTTFLIGYSQPHHWVAPTTSTTLHASAFNTTAEGCTNTNDEAPVKKGYVRAEEWDAQRKTSLQWEEKVQFDGRRHGNRWQQNEILRHNLFK